MATRTIESRFERMSVNDENDPGDGSKYQKSKVSCTIQTNTICLHGEGCYDDNQLSALSEL